MLNQIIEMRQFEFERRIEAGLPILMKAVRKCSTPTTQCFHAVPSAEFAAGMICERCGGNKWKIGFECGDSIEVSRFLMHLEPRAQEIYRIGKKHAVLMDEAGFKYYREHRQVLEPCDPYWEPHLAALDTELDTVNATETEREDAHMAARMGRLRK